MVAGASSTTTVSARASKRSEQVSSNTWKPCSAATSLSSSMARSARSSSKVTKGSSRMMRRPAVHGHEAHEAEPGGQEELVGGPTRELADIHELARLGYAHPEGEAPLIDLDLVVTTRR